MYAYLLIAFRQIMFRKAYRLLLLVLLLLVEPICLSADVKGKKVLVVTSYNPDIQSTATFLSDFVKKIEASDSDVDVMIESMNCLAYSEAKTWKERMEAILARHLDTNVPDLVVVLGQEAWSSYLSQDSAVVKKFPVMCAMVSRNTVLLPEEDDRLQRWMPESKDVFNDFPEFNIVGGYVYEYNLDKNIELIKTLYPNTHELVFLSDNSFGGVSMQALVRDRMAEYPQYKFSFIDGRVKSLVEAGDYIGSLSPHCVLLCGTWRVGPSDDFVLKTTTYVLRDANPTLPVLTLSTVGLGHWALGGYVPSYSNLGAAVAIDCIDFLNSRNDAARQSVSVVDGQYVFDCERIEVLGVDERLLPADASFINRPESFFERYEAQIIAVIVLIILLLAGLVISFTYIRRIRRLKDELECKSRELALAKDAAEKASEMKTRFIQNISHEIRTPLNAIVGFAQVVANADASPLKKYSVIIERNSEDLLKLVGDVVELSNLDSGMTETPQPVVMSELCNDVLLHVESKRAEDVEFSFIPPANDRPYKMYRHGVELVVMNLLHNAFKFTESGFVSLNCDVIGGGSLMRVTVTDTGCGIPADMREEIFERFTKVDSFKQGGGLGLAICRAVAAFTGATIELDTTYDRGAKFVFIFPLLD